MTRYWNHRRGRWEVDNKTEADMLKRMQPEPVFLYDRKTKTYKEYRIPVKRIKPIIKNGRLIKKEYWDDDIWS